ncbi:hypothetical protein [Stenotrophomonas phage IME-SM1]|uniref:Uncharacterized protein n=1 Tax=Stenotrophomonas phage IME-SM1 TaxID=1654717 RepID=A0A0H4IPF5_9CAUD|nr:hypothetical protein KMC40_gp123 [Stenotrophomonas phage IME-SM1]AKO61635.1 hypothetical protein [Stenotrophomonas phage IME-SM1]
MSEFRIRMETKDGQLVQDRKDDVDMFYSGEAYYRYRRLDEKAVQRTLEYAPARRVYAFFPGKLVSSPASALSWSG